MNVSRYFILAGAVYLIIGVCFGIYMASAAKYSFAPVHAHINLLGFTLMTVFGILSRVFPETGLSRLARIHFWLHLGGTVVMLTMLYLLFAGHIRNSAMFPIAPISEAAILLGIVLYAYNVLTNLK